MKKIDERVQVVVIGSIHHNTLGVIRSLGEAGISAENIRVILVTSNMNKNMITVSTYVDKSNIICVSDCDKIIECLTKIAKDGKKRVIICCSDATAEMIVSHATYLNQWYSTPSTKCNILELMEKDVQCNIARDCGLCVPYDEVVGKGDKLKWDFFPCITKPIKSAIGAGKQDICIVNSRDELDETLSNIEAETIQLQEYIEKEFEFQLIGCSLDAGDIVLIPGYTQIIRQPKNTNTGYLKYLPIESLNINLSKVNNFIKRIGYSGLFSVEFLRGQDGNNYFLEINMRNDGNAYCVQSAGVNLPFIWVYYQTFFKMPATNLKVDKEIFFIPDFNDLKVAVRTDGFFSWLKDFMLAESHSIYNKKDMRPFIFEIARQIKRIISGINR